MEKLKRLSHKKAAEISTDFKRFLYQSIDWTNSLTIILGHRGSGKTTLLLQRMKEAGEQSIYLSLDDIYFEGNRLIHVLERFYEEGYRKFFLDEVHRYEYWSRDLKNAFDNYSDIQLFATGSSILELSKGKADLSRRAVLYHLPGLSFREFLKLANAHSFDALDLETILHSHHEIAANYYDQLDIMKSFRNYLKYGYYPFFKEGINTYGSKLQETTNLVLEIDIAPFEEVTYATVRNMKKLLYVISQSVPFKPNISKLAKKMNVPRNSILKMLDLLDRAKVLSLLKSHTSSISYLQKPEKIYLQNPNLVHLLSDYKPEMGNLRETFFFNQTRVQYDVTSAKRGDFTIDKTYTFEIGGPSKTAAQIQGIPNSFIAADGIKGGTGNKIPLWLFGFLY